MGTEPKSLEDLELDNSLAGSEGLDPNYVSRIRIQYLLTQHQTIITQMQFADAKAAALITVIGIVALRSPLFSSVEALMNIGWFGILIILTLSLSILFTLLSVFPRYPSRKLREDMVLSDRWSWPSLVNGGFSAAQYADFMRGAEVSQLVQSVALSNANVSAVLLNKYKMLRIGFALGTLAFLLGVVNLVGFV